MKTPPLPTVDAFWERPGFPLPAEKIDPVVETGAAGKGRTEEAWFLGDWTGMMFVHYEVAPDLLQKVVPFPLDLQQGRALVSLVAFTMHRFRPARGGALSAWMLRPLATQGFLNLRTYVEGKLGPGIYFMHEWIDHPLAVPLGPALFGLPYHPGRLIRGAAEARRSLEISAGGNHGALRGHRRGPVHRARRGSLEEFLVERYTAYTSAGIRPLAFRVWHEPWGLEDLLVESDTLPAFLAALGQGWTETLRPVSAQWSEGVTDVRMGRPHRA